MRKQLLAAATVLALAARATTSAKAFDQKPGASARHAGHAQAGTIGGTRHFGARHRVARASGFVNPRRDGWEGDSAFGRGGFVDLGPLGITTACGSYSHRPAYCGEGYSIEAWSR